MSSGNLWSSRFSFFFLPFLPAVVPVPGRLMLAVFPVTGAKSSLAISLGSFANDVRKSILTASFFCLLLGLAAPASASAI